MQMSDLDCRLLPLVFQITTNSHIFHDHWTNSNIKYKKLCWDSGNYYVSVVVTVSRSEKKQKMRSASNVVVEMCEKEMRPKASCGQMPCCECLQQMVLSMLSQC